MARFLNVTLRNDIRCSINMEHIENVHESGDGQSVVAMLPTDARPQRLFELKDDYLDVMKRLPR